MLKQKGKEAEVSYQVQNIYQKLANKNILMNNEKTHAVAGTK